MDGIKAVILDMDGVLWRDAEPIGDLQSIFKRMQQAGLGVVLASNNASRSSLQHLFKIRSFGVENLEPWQIVSSSDAAAAYLKTRFPNGGKIYVVGEKPLIDVLGNSGFVYAESEVVAVVAGIDRTLTYKKIDIASQLIRAGALFIGTNPDKTYPVPGGFAPGAGTVLAAIEAASGVEPIIIGKPLPAMYEIALSRLGTKPDETLVVGDRLETDIVGAQTIGCKTALVLSGVTSYEDAIRAQPQPDLVRKNLAEVLDTIISSH